MSSYKSSHVRLGHAGEKYVKGFLRQLGVVCETGTPGDIVSGSISIEVKAARPTEHQRDRQLRHQFCINRWQHTTFRSDFLILLCYSRKRELIATYVIPGDRVNGNHKIVISSSAYTGSWAAWLDAWENILTHPGVEYARS